jgi:hypothetical protein
MTAVIRHLADDPQVRGEGLLVRLAAYRVLTWLRVPYVAGRRCGCACVHGGRTGVDTTMLGGDTRYEVMDTVG